MKNILTKLGYMAFGCLLTLIGYHFGNVDNNSVDAQGIVKEKAEIVDEIRCRKLVIVGDDDTKRIILETDFRDRGSIGIRNEDGAQRIFLGIRQNDSGSLQVSGSKEFGSMAAELGVDDYGGFMALWNKVLDKSVLEAGITSKGHGYIVIRDKAGEQLRVMGPLGIFVTNQKMRK